MNEVVKKRLSQEQAANLSERIRPMMAYCLRVRQRMDEIGLANDELYSLVDKAYGALQHLSVELHYRSVAHGVGRASD